MGGWRKFRLERWPFSWWPSRANWHRKCAELHWTLAYGDHLKEMDYALSKIGIE
jgi:hypothetical protein